MAALSTTVATDDLLLGRIVPSGYPDSARASFTPSAVSWGAIFAGAAAAAALSLILLILGTGLGLSSVSPWAHSGVSAETFGFSTILWITLTQLIASGLGGYLAGRLRTKWLAVHTDEVYFRDTAHGFLAWAVASLATAAFLSSAIGFIASGGIQAGASTTGGFANAAATVGGATAAAQSTKADSEFGSAGYFIDSLFRRDMNAATDAGAAPTVTAVPATEVARIFASAGTDALPPEDVRYLGQVVAQRTGMALQDAERRVIDTYAKMQATFRDTANAAKVGADAARKASAYAALWLFISLLVGAFVASVAATHGGRRRDTSDRI